MHSKSHVLKTLQEIPSVGPATANDLWLLGIRSVTDLRNRDPREMYDLFNAMTAKRNDICLLYVFRCAVYFATEKEPEKRKLAWWYWKDRTYNENGTKRGSRRTT